MRHILNFDNFLNENVETDIKKINKSIFDNLDPFDGIAGGECHDIALIAYIYCQNSGFLENPKIMWTSNHAWIEGDYNGTSCIFDIVAVNQKHLGDAFKLATDNKGQYYYNPKVSTETNTYVSINQGVNISVEDAEYGVEELLFLDDYIK